MLKINLKSELQGGHRNAFTLCMKRFSQSLLVVAFIAMIFVNNAKADQGGELYKKHCATCHAITSKVLVGPGLEGITDKRENEWLFNWIQNPMKMVNEGDEQAVKVYKEFNEVPMPDFEKLSDGEINSIITYLEENAVAQSKDSQAPVSSAAGSDSEGEATFSNWDRDLIFWGSIALIITFLFITRFKKRVSKTLTDHGYHSDPHEKPDLQKRMLGFLIAAAVLVWLVIKGLEANFGVFNMLMFIVLPYLSFGIFLVGSIYRYKNKGYQVSSLSSQFLEGKKLFWGSQPFHWGLLVLFFGHLIAFLFPSAILAWNGEPVRLLILEISSFAFGILALLGLILLFKRRMTTRLLLVVSNKMDLVVYSILFIQVLSGLGVAFFVRWGSSWFSSVLTPYLRSVFSFNPDMTALAEMPWLIQLHVISAFVLIGIIPFTRFMHFLVAPIDYLWRKYQIVIWNWSPKHIRKSTRHTYGKKPRNH